MTTKDVYLLVSGSRAIVDVQWTEARIEQALLTDWGLTLDQVALVLNGNAVGVDTITRKWAAHKGLPVKLYKPNWAKHGKAAGILRNHEMVKEATHIIALWDGVSPGTLDVIKTAEAMEEKKLLVYKRATPSI
jgi:hypothetical protein